MSLAGDFMSRIAAQQMTVDAEISVLKNIQDERLLSPIFVTTRGDCLRASVKDDGFLRINLAGDLAPDDALDLGEWLVATFGDGK